jgi:hypothetical protein
VARGGEERVRRHLPGAAGERSWREREKREERERE